MELGSGRPWGRVGGWRMAEVVMRRSLVTSRELDQQGHGNGQRGSARGKVGMVEAFVSLKNF